MIDAQPQRSQLVLDKAIDRVRKLLALSKNASEHEAALAAGKATQLIEQFQLTEAMIRIDDVEAKPEPIEQSARLEPELPEYGGRGSGRKRIAWKEAIATAVARDLGIHIWWKNDIDMRGFGRESAIQTWRYTYQYLCRAVDQMADEAWIGLSRDDIYGGPSARAWKNAFRVGCAQRLSIRIWEEREARKRHREDSAKKVEIMADETAARVAPQNFKVMCQALAIVEKDQKQVDDEYEAYSKKFGTVRGVGSTSSYSGYESGQRAGDRISLGRKRAGLASGQRRIGAQR